MDHPPRLTPRRRRLARRYGASMTDIWWSDATDEVALMAKGEVNRVAPLEEAGSWVDRRPRGSAS